MVTINDCPTAATLDEVLAAPAAPPAPAVASIGHFMERLRENAYANLSLAGYTPDLQGWNHPRFESRVQTILDQGTGGPIRILEVGSWKGLSASILGRLARARNDGSTVLCIDTWLGAPEFWTWGLDSPERGVSLGLKNGYPSVFYTFTRNMKSLGLERQVIPFPISADQGFDVLRHYGANFDLIYIDAAHEESAVLRDMENAWSVLSPGGILFGDDYTPEVAGVVSAVNRFVRTRRLKGVNDEFLWFVPKPVAAR